MSQLRMTIPNISCNHCAGAITRALKGVAGVKDVAVDVPAKSVSVTFDAPANEETLVAAVTEIGYPPKGA